MNKVLVAYASKCGSTGEVAQAIAQELCSQGMTVDAVSYTHLTLPTICSV